MTDRRGWMEIATAAVLSFILSLSGPLALIMLLPLQFVASQKGKDAFLYSAGGFLALSLMVNYSSLAGMGRALLVGKTALLVFLTGGIYALNFAKVKGSEVIKLLIVTTCTGILSIPVLYLVGGDGTFNEAVLSMLNKVLTLLREGAGDTLIRALKVEDLYTLFKNWFLSSYLLSYFIIVAVNWRLGRRAAYRFRVDAANNKPNKEFDIPHQLVWLLFIPLTIVLIRMLLANKGFQMDLGVGGYAVSNCLYIMGALYGIRGISLIRYLLVRKGTRPQSAKVMTNFMVIFFLIVPVAAPLLLLLPVLGVSELWINYRRTEKELIQ